MGEENLSDHLCVETQVNLQTTSPPQLQKKRYKISDMEKFKEVLASKMTQTNFTKTPTQLQAILEEACAKTTTARVHLRRPGKPPKYWWTQDIAEKRKECNKARRALKQTHRSDEERIQALTRYRKSRATLKRAIADSKTKRWQELLEQVQADPWGKPYRIV